MDTFLKETDTHTYLQTSVQPPVHVACLGLHGVAEVGQAFLAVMDDFLER